MINLLPDDQKKNIRAARMNVTLLRYNFILFGVLAAISATFALLYLGLQSDQKIANDNKSANQTLASKYAKDQAEITDYAKNLKLARGILDNTVSYTALINAMTELLPSGVILDSINFQAANIGQQTTFSAHAKSYTKAVELKERFQKSTIFSNVFLQNVQEVGGYRAGGDGGGIYSDYQFSVSISATINKGVKL